MNAADAEELRLLVRRARMLVLAEREAGVIDLPGTPAPAQSGPAAGTSPGGPAAGTTRAASLSSSAPPASGPPPSLPAAPRPGFVPPRPAAAPRAPAAPPAPSRAASAAAPGPAPAAAGRRDDGPAPPAATPQRGSISGRNDAVPAPPTGAATEPASPHRGGLPVPPPPQAPAAPSALPAPSARIAPPPARPQFIPAVRALDLPPDVLAPFGDLPARVAACTLCGLCRERTIPVFGEGSPRTQLVFCGEAPGHDEDLSGRPFVGASGELLTAMIEKGLKMRREDVFILNSVKCRPPGNRTPAPDEIAACRPFLEEQLAAIRPKVIVALGNPASRALLGNVPGIMTIRGRMFTGFGATIVPTYHPAYLLRNPAGKADVWKDLQLVMRILAGG